MLRLIKNVGIVPARFMKTASARIVEKIIKIKL